MEKEDLVNEMYLKLSDLTYIEDIVNKDEFVDIVSKILHDYVVIPKAYIIQ